ncbi:unnamed protein product [Menidia menidia]|uniref:(Atlantic silverside) hypothetical protein n=1 Tax=Menidia menidia TaxID=238744 RepID=A0A8S4B7W7_9TELE|nr:unnamed protein product [Menidia menidia]
MRKDTGNKMVKPFRGLGTSPDPPTSPSSTSTSPGSDKFFGGPYHPPSPVRSSAPSSSESGSGSESPLTRILKQHLGDCRLRPSAKRGPTYFVLYDKEKARLPTCVVSPSRPLEVIDLEAEDDTQTPANLNPLPASQPLEITNLEAEEEEDTQILSCLSPPSHSQLVDIVDPEEEDSELPPGQGIPPLEAGGDEFDGWIHFGFIKAVKTAVLHLLNTAIKMFLEETCYGCSVNHPKRVKTAMAGKNLIRRAFYTPAHPGSFGGVDRLRRGVQSDTGKRIAIEKVKDFFLSEQDTYTLHKPARITFPRNRVFVTGPLKQFQADLCDMQALFGENDGYNYLLTVIDIFSKRAYARVLKRKTASEVAKTFESVLKESQIPKKLQTDAATITSIIQALKVFEKSFTDEIFIVTEVIKQSTPVFKLKDLDGETFQGAFYSEELQTVKLSKDKMYQVGEILNKRTVRGVKQVLVRWKNWPDKFNSWVREADLLDV